MECLVCGNTNFITYPNCIVLQEIDFTQKRNYQLQRVAVYLPKLLAVKNADLF